MTAVGSSFLFLFFYVDSHIFPPSLLPPKPAHENVGRQVISCRQRLAGATSSEHISRTRSEI